MTETKAPEQKKPEPRRHRREKRDAVKLFNNLLFQFINIEAQKTSSAFGILNIPIEVYEEAKRMNGRWRRFCHLTKLNNKKKLAFKQDALDVEMQKHIRRHKESVWTKYLKDFLKSRYGIEMPITATGQYIELNRKPEEIAKEIYQNLNTMYKIEIPDIKFATEIPEEISEMTTEQFVFFAEMILKLYSKAIDVYDLKTAMVMKFLGVKYSTREYNGLPETVRAKISENTHGLTELLDYFFEEKEGKLMIKSGFTKNLIPVLKLKNHPLLKGPADALTDISFLEYKDANTAYRAYLENQEADSLNELIAIIYRPYVIPFLSEKFRLNHPAFSRKRKYRVLSLRKRKQRIAKLPEALRFAIFLNYMAFEDYLRTGKLHMDGMEINLKTLYETTLKEKQLQIKNKYEENTGLAGIALALASSGIYGTVDSVYKQNLYDVLLLLYKQRIEYLNQLENIKK